ncbi:succinate--CoA ligase subunit alpha [Geovibrio thiophilus]|uniref:Succinate--CoA ligase [ADP-forming] subunit alpha n=1 Tax=Geovibrio thiophilus TaxID=139438 RepID=A0A3R6AZK3_9BACT|nr:succinate--CoA ligase subunit alpha [Geovibrio thiophilus]QAR34161.1 succinate--CoA ligase subunit alpha [Geovibrio thiophilus]
MSILINNRTKVIVQGLTGSQGKFHSAKMKEYGTNIVAGVVPGKGGESVDGTPVFDTVEEAVRATGANASIIYVPPAYAADSIMEAVDANLDVCVCITEGIPVKDMLAVKRMIKTTGSRTMLIGPNCPGVITPGECKMGIMPGEIHTPGTVGIISKSGTLTYEAVKQVSAYGLGQSTCVGIGGDPVIGLKYIDLLEMFEYDAQTELVVLIGEIGGQAEVKAGEWIKNNFSKPVVSFIAGQTAPKGKRMGHAGAIISGGDDTAASKMKRLAECGVHVVELPSDIGKKVAEVLGKI